MTGNINYQEQYDVHNNTSDKINELKNEITTKHGKPIYLSVQLHFDSETETDPSDTEETRHLRKNQIFDDYIVSFENKIVQFLQNLHFRTKSMKFVLCFILCFSVKNAVMKNNDDEYPSIPS